MGPRSVLFVTAFVAVGVGAYGVGGVYASLLAGGFFVLVSLAAK